MFALVKLVFACLQLFFWFFGCLTCRMFALEKLLFGCLQHFLVFECLTYRMFALVKLVFACLRLFLVFRKFEISDVCPGKAAFRIFAALFGFSDVWHIRCLPW